MSFNNHLTFGVSKSTPTTSTTNTNSNSISDLKDIAEPDKPNTGRADSSRPENSSNIDLNSTVSANKSQFIHGMLLKSSSDRESPKFISSPVLSGAAPTVVTYGHENVTSSNANTSQQSNSSNRKDLLELFDKFDLLDKKDNLDSIEPGKDEETEDKFDRYKRLKDAKDSSIAFDEDSISGGHDGGSEVIEEKHLDSVCSTSPQDRKFNNAINHNSSQQNDVGQKTHSDDLIDLDPVQKGNAAPLTPSNEKIIENDSPTDGKDLSPENEADQSIDKIEEDENMAVEKYQLTEEEINKHKASAYPSSAKRPEVGSRSLSQVNVNPASQYEQSHKPFDFHIFLEQLKKKSADPIVRYIRSFLISFNRQSHTFSLQQKSKIVRDFKAFMHEKFTLFEPFASMDETDLENSREGLEKLIMNRVYVHCFPPELIKKSAANNSGLVARSIAEDKEFSWQLEKFSWVNGNHLDVDLDKLTQLKARTSAEDLNFMQFAIKELKKINDYRAPRDKIICILNACKIIFGFLRVNNQETNADAFMPILILIIIKAKIDHLISNIQYIENFRGTEWLNHGETSYYLSSLQGAINFIQNLALDDLSIGKEEFDAHMEAWAANERIRKQQEATENIPIEQPRPQHGYQQDSAMSPSSVLMTSAEMFTKSISQFLSPSPQETPASEAQTIRNQRGPGNNTEPNEEEAKRISETAAHLKEIFPNLDQAVLSDIVYLHKGDMDNSLDGCLQVVSE